MSHRYSGEARLRKAAQLHPKLSLTTNHPPRTAPFDREPGFYEPAGLWLFGNVRALASDLVCIEATLGLPRQSPAELDAISQVAETLVLESKVLVTGIHNFAQRRAAVVPLRWGAPRILVLSGGFKHHLGPNLAEEPFHSARLWRHRWDPETDLAVSWRAPEKLPTFACHNPTVDRLVVSITNKKINGCLFGNPEF